jgi:hypothetical protein
MGKRSVSVGLVAALAAGIIALSAPSASALTSTESCFLSKHNAERSSAGRKSLANANDLVEIARRHSARMADDNTIYHNKNLPNEVGGNWYALGENVGMGPSCDSLHNAFMDSPGHRANILDADYNQAGVGVVVKDGTIFVTVVFAGRKSSTTTTTTKPKPTVRKPAPRPAPRPKPAVAPKPAPKPAPPVAPPVPQTAASRSVSVLMQLVGLDAQQVDPATGAAMGV